MRLIIHPGFSKCGSSSIQTALRHNQAALKRRSVFLFGEGLRIIRRSAPFRGRPFWAVADALLDRRDTPIAPLILREIERLAAREPEASVVLSAELLAQPSFAPLFKGVDEGLDTHVIFYVRPQYEWIPSSWQQWSLKSGTPLRSYVEKCLSSGVPQYRETLESWAEALPNARVSVRILAEAGAKEGGIAADFLELLDPEARYEIADALVNPSLDYAILHILNKNPQLFRSTNDNKPFHALSSILPESFKRTNIDLLPFEQRERIAERFRDDNMKIIESFYDLHGRSVESVYDSYFKPTGGDPSYLDASELETVYRAFGILLEAEIRRGQDRIFRPPYWKIGRRILQRVFDTNDKR